MTQTELVLALAQFLAGFGFMLAFLALELGLAWVLVYFRLRARAGALPWMQAYRFWVRVYALSLILSFAAAVPVLLHLGTAWPGFMDRAGEVAGPLIAATVLTAFVFKSCFLGAMLYGQRRLGNAAHTLMVFLVAVGASVTAYWIMALLAWMQKPVGAFLAGGHYRVRSWTAILLDTPAPVLFGVMLLGGLLLAGALMLAVTAVRTRDRPSDEGDRIVYGTGIWLLLAAVALQTALVAGLARELMPAQPARAAAVVPLWHGEQDVRASLFARLDESGQATTWSWDVPLPVPGWLPREPDGRLRGLDHFSGMTPPVAATYWSARIVLLGGVILAILGVAAAWRALRLRHDPGALRTPARLLLRLAMPLACVVQLSGLVHLFVGAMPYAVYGTVTLRELLGADATLAMQGGVVAGQLLVQALLLLGFYQLLRHITRYGVVPVARHRGRA